jgi:uncharacterized protein (TIGR00369 family)
MAWDAPNPDWIDSVRRVFADAPFLADLGIVLADCGPGWCEATLAIQPRHLQQTGVAHAGVITTLADHTAGGAATSLLAADTWLLTVEFKVHLLRPGRGETLFCRSEVLKPGRGFHVAESEVYALDAGKRTLVAKLSGTMAVLDRR